MRISARAWWSLVMTAVLGGGMLACSEGTAPTEPPAMEVEVGGPILTGGPDVRLTTSCGGGNQTPYVDGISINCVEIWGQSNQVPYSADGSSWATFTCKAWGTAYAGPAQGQYRLVATPSSEPFSAFPTGMGMAGVIDPMYFTFKGYGLRPTSPATVRCIVGATWSPELAVQITGPAPYLEAVWIGTPNGTTVNAGGDLDLVAHYHDQYGFDDLLPTPTHGWTSDNQSVATVNVSTGRVHGVSAGTANITLMGQGTAGQKFATIGVTVRAAPYLDHVTIPPPAQTSLNYGQSVTLTALLWDQYGNSGQITPPPTVTWTSSDLNVATVNASGIVTAANQAGPVTITASAPSPSGTKSASIGLTVTGCTMTTSPAGSVNTKAGLQVNATAAVSCPSGFSVPAGNWIWTTTGPMGFWNDNSQQSAVHFTPTAGGTGTAKVCTPAGVGRTCSPLLTLNIFGVSAVPQTPGTQTVLPNTTGSVTFNVTNTGPIAGTAILACNSSGQITCTGLSTTSLALAVGETKTVNANWSTGATTGFGSVNLTGNGASASAQFNVAGGALTASIAGAASVRPNVTCDWGATVNGGTAPYTFNWRNKPSGSLGTDPWLTFTNTGTNFTLYVDVTDALGATVTASKAVSISASAPQCLV